MKYSLLIVLLVMLVLSPNQALAQTEDLPPEQPSSEELLIPAASSPEQVVQTEEPDAKILDETKSQESQPNEEPPEETSFEDESFDDEFLDEDTDVEEYPFEWGGFFMLEYRFLFGDNKKEVPYSDGFSKLRLKFHKDISENVSAHGSGELRLYGTTNASTPEDLSDPAKQYEIDPMLWEAYFDVYDMGVEGLDLRVGKQRIAWGKADKLNPTDNLDADDFQDVFQFGEHIPSVAIRLTYAIKEEVGLEFIWLPTTKPVLLPRGNALQLGGEAEAALAPMMAQYQSLPITLGETSVQINTPGYDLRHSMQAFKIKGTLFKIDYSFSYLHGFDDVPVPEKMTITLDPNDPLTAIPNLEMGFFEYHVAGFDFAGELLGMGWWVEGAVFFPQNDVAITIITPDFTDPTKTVESKAEVFDKTPYSKVTAGLDYTFSWSMYINLQYAHGMFIERGKEENINDYLFIQVDQKFLHDKLKLGLTGGFGIMDWSDVKNNYGWLINPEISGTPYDSIELALGVYVIDAKGDNFFGALKKMDLVYAKFQVDF